MNGAGFQCVASARDLTGWGTTMICADCGHHNEPNARFCAECGAPLSMRCRACDAPQPAGAKFCNQCGHRLDAGPEPPGGPTAPTATAAVRKSVTAVFVDLVGSTAFGERLDPEAVRSAIAPYHELVRTTIEDHAGTLVKFMGDGAMAVFGLPEVAEDDAIRAVSAGVDLQRRFQGFADQIRDRHGVELGLRVGINSGELVIADDDADLVGDVLNTAARLEASCDPGAVMVGEDTWRLTRSVVEYEVLAEIRVKGKSEPIATFRVVEEEHAIAHDIPFVGRGTELGQLLAAFRDARDSPMAKLVTVIGAPGVGKTRLAAELREAVDARSFDLRFERRGSTTFTPIAQLLRDVTDGTIEGVTRLFTSHGDEGRLVPILGSFLGHGEARSTEESFWAVRRLLEHLAAAEPLIIVVDDIQWAEPLFWDLLDHLVEWATAPVLIVALARPELRDLRPELAQAGRRVAAAIPLGGLDDAATRELAARLLDTDELPGELLERIPASTEGNPLFIRELVQMLVDDGTLAPDGDRWRLTIDADAIEVPPTILSLLATRVERLPGDERQVVELASVIGTNFDRGTLAAIAPDDVTSRLGALLDRLRRKDLIEPSGAWAGDHPVYRFHHVLIRDAAYRRLLKGRRADLHALVGRHDDSDDASAETDVVVAHHYEQTVQYRTELGTVDDATTELARLAVAKLRRAAGEALGREDLPAAGGYARRALALVATDDPARDELLVTCCEALLSSGDAAGATPFVRELHERSSDDRLVAWADCFRAQRWMLTDPDRLTEAAELTDDAAGRLDALDDQAGVARARLVRALCLARLGRVGACEEELDLALGAARAAGDRRRTVAVLGAAPLAALWGPSPVARAGGRCLDVLRLLRITTASPAVEATSIRCQAMLEALRGRFDSARTKLEASRATANELGLRQGLYETEWFAGFVEMWAGDPVAAEPHLRAARDGLGRLGIGADAGQAAAMLARALLAQGRTDAAAQLAQEALDAAGENLQTAIASRAALAEVRAAQGNHSDARELAGEALEIAQETDLALDRILALFAARRVATAGGDATAAARHAATAASLLESKGVSDEVDNPHDLPAGRPTGGRPTVAESGRASDRIIARLTRVMSDGPFAEYTDLFAPEFECVDHREIGFGVRNRHDYLASTEAIVGNVIAHGVVEQLGADDGISLVRTGLSSKIDDSTWDLYLLQEDDGEQITRWEQFPVDQRDAALARFAERQAERARPAGSDAVEQARARFLGLADRESAHDGNTASRLYREFSEVAGDPGRWHDFLDPDFVETARYRLNVGQRLDRDQFRDVNMHQIELAGSVSCTTELIAWRDDELCLSRLTMLLGDDRQEYLAVVRAAGDRITSMDLFDDTQLGEALDELDRRWIDTVAPDDAARLVAGFLRAAGGGPDELRDLLAPDCTCVDHRQLGMGARSREEVVATLGDVVGHNAIVEASLLRSGERAALIATRIRMHRGDVEWDEISLLGGDGPLDRWEIFAGDDVDRAIGAFDRLTAGPGASEGNTAWRLLSAFRSAGRDRAAKHELLHPDFVDTAHYRMSSGEQLDRDRFIDLHFDPIESAGHWHDRIELVAWRGDHLCLAHVMMVFDDNEIEFQVVVRTSDDAIVSMDRFDPDQLDDALDELDRRWVARTPRAAPDAPSPVAPSGYRRSIAAIEAAWASEDLEAMAATLRPDVVIHSFRNVVTPGHTRGDEAIAATLALCEFFPHISIEVVAERDDDLGLGQFTLRNDDAMELEMLIVGRTDSDGRIVRMATFDQDRLLDALDLLDEWWEEAGGPAAAIAANRVGRRAWAVPGIDRDRHPFADDYVTVDHRLVGLGTRELEEFLDSARFITPADIVITRYVATAEPVHFYEIRFVRHEDGFLWHALHVGRIDDDGIHEIHVFDPDQHDEAAELFERMVASGPLGNAATAMSDAWTRNVLGGQPAPHEQFFEPDFVFAGRRSSAPHLDGGVDHITGMSDFWLAAGLTAMTDRVVAIRDDHLCLVETTATTEAGDEAAFLFLCELGASGRAKRMTAYDTVQLGEALDELDRWWVASGGPAVIARNWSLLRRAMAGVDATLLDELLHPGFVDVDHRRLGKGMRGRDDYRGMMLDLGHAGAVAWPTRFLAVGDGVALADIEMVAEDGGAEWRLLCVSQYADGRLYRNEPFGIDDLAGAQARFDELVAEALASADEADAAAGEGDDTV